MFSRILVLGCFLCSHLTAQNQAPPPKLTLIIIEGEDAINNVRQRVVREPVVQVEDENHKPVAGAVVTFLLPDKGASGVFLDGSKSLFTVTDESGKAVARGLQANKVAGRFQIRVTASFQGQVASTSISQVNAVVAAAAAGGAAGAGTAAAAAGIGKIVLIVAIVAGAAVGGGLAAASKGGGSSTPASSTPVVTPTTTIGVGGITVGPPR